VADLFQEVEEELRKDRAEELWKKYGRFIIAAAVLVVLVTTGQVLWREYSERQQQEAARSFLGAVRLAEDGRTDEATAAFEALAADGPAGYGTLARFRTAALLAESGDGEGALQIYASLAADADLGSLYRDLAVLLSVLHQSDSGDPGSLLDQLEPLRAESNPWRHSATELAAVQQLRSGDRGAAVALLQELADDLTAPQAARARAAELLRTLEG